MHALLLFFALGQSGAPLPEPFTLVPVHHAPPSVQWFQPVQPQPIVYPTPLRNFFFGRTRMVPAGPPVPYRWEPGRWVPAQETPQ